MSDMISRADAIAAVTQADKDCRGAEGARENIRALPAVEVGVRELEWTQYDADTWTATPLERTIRIKPLSGVYRWQYGVMGTWHIAASLEAAKAAAQADYAARIRSALTATPAQDWLSNCAICGRVVDTREISAGGDGHGCEYDNGWACSSKCAEKLNPDPNWMKPTPAQDVVGIGAAALENLLDRRGLREPLSAIKFDDPEVWREICEATGAAALARMKEDFLNGI